MTASNPLCHHLYWKKIIESGAKEFPQWVQCSRCLKWRTINVPTALIGRPPDVIAPTGWICSHNEPPNNSCDAALETPSPAQYTPVQLYALVLQRQMTIVAQRQKACKRQLPRMPDSSEPPPKRMKLSNNPKSNSNGDVTNAINPYPGHMSIEQASSLSVGDAIDFRDVGGRYYRAWIQEKKGDNLRIHFVKWNEKFDEWIDYKTSIHRIAIIRSISERPAHRLTNLKVGDFIDVRLTLLHREWEMAEIVDRLENSGQVQVKYHTDSNGVESLYWVHLDDEQETAPFRTKSVGLDTDDMKHCDSNDSNNKDEGVITELVQRNQELQDKVDLLSAKPERIVRLGLDELCALQSEMKRNMERVEEMKKEISDKTYRCIVCMDKRKNVIFDGCDHVTLCDECEGKSETKKCPICQAPYTNARTMILY